MRVGSVRKTGAYSNWFRRLSDRQAKARILNRIDRAENGSFGDYRSVGEGVSEMRIDYGPGYRIYFAQEGRVIYLLLMGGDKRNQEKDIAKAKAMWQAIRKKEE
ncbi:MAG: type II toxin-antitoxin system RelE/ParE family toxin [Planctomycetes bacterium]|nr:type II toxin-antitoxin system RelE/ParE family toxin [Planctomycetota bacterium]